MCRSLFCLSVQKSDSYTIQGKMSQLPVEVPDTCLNVLSPKHKILSIRVSEFAYADIKRYSQMNNQSRLNDETKIAVNII